MSEHYDLLIIGGGINGVGIAADAAQRGLSVILCEQGDFAGATSSASTKLIHGGLRYLEHHEYGLVRKSLIERQCLLKLAPHLIKPLEFIAPYVATMRPAWMMRLGLFIYDHLYFNNQLPHTHKVTPATAPIDFAPLCANIKFGFSYYDCSVLDARLVIVNAIAARRHNAQLLPRTSFISATRYADHWQAVLKPQQAATIDITAKCIINAGGPWVGEILKKLNLESAYNMQLVQGSHIIIPRLYAGNHAYILQNDDKRIIFSIPYHFNTTLIGTTDVNFNGNPSNAHISNTEQQYLCAAINKYFIKHISPADILHTYSGVRPLLADDSASPAEITRDYKLVLDCAAAPILSIYGGKITTYRKLAENALLKLKPFFNPLPASTTATTPLPGADFENQSFQQFQQQFLQQHHWLEPSISQRLINSYGNLAYQILAGCIQISDLGEHFGAGLYAREVDYLVTNEWARTLDDIIWRRSKLGLILSKKQKISLERYLLQTNFV